MGGGNFAQMSQAAPQPSERLTDATGLADFGVVHPGDYVYQIVTQWDEGTLATSGEIHVEPGSQIHKRIVCPRTPPERVPVRVRWTWPADLEKEKLLLYASFDLHPIRRDGLSWTLSDERPPKSSSKRSGLRNPMMVARMLLPTRSVLCGPATSMTQVLPSEGFQPYLWRDGAFPAWRLWASLPGSDLRSIPEPEGSLQWERGTYHLSGVLVLRPSAAAESQAGRRSFEVVVAGDPGSQQGVINGTYWVYWHPPTDAAADGPRGRGGRPKAGAQGQLPTPLGRLDHQNSGQPGRPEIVRPWESWSKMGTAFEARPGQVNEWTIPLPDEVIEAIRQRLKAGANAKAE
jgi:hypothetical protein